MREPAGSGQEEWCRECGPELFGSSILFTSGTTSLPKGCSLQTSAYPLTLATSMRQSSQPMLPGNKVAFVLPNNHSFGYLFLMSSFISAATIVFPGTGFAPEAMIQTIQREQCSHTALVSTMVIALNGIPLSPDQKLRSLRRVMLAGAHPNEEVIRICLGHLGSSGVENLYGMTEGILLSSGIVGHVSDIINGRNISVGSPLPGAKVRVCAEGSRDPLPVEAVGEVHFSGPTLIKGYIGRADDDQFYTEQDGRRWFCTGDKAIMGKDCRCYLVGRYKDTIIRGGENIEPSSIEAVLGQLSEFSVLEHQIVRAPDYVAGEIPVAIVNQKINQETAHRLKETIQAKMGIIYVPSEVVPVQFLGINAYPKTSAGKVQKSKLEEMIKAYRGEQRPQACDKLYIRCLLESRLKWAWARLVGLSDASQIDVNAGLNAFAIGPALGQLQRKLWEDVRSNVSFSDWVAAGSIAEQARLIEQCQQYQPTEPMRLCSGQSFDEPPIGSRIMEWLLSVIAVEQRKHIDPATRIIDLGVDSILSITILNRVQKETGVSLPSSIFLTQKTVGEISDRLCLVSTPEELPDFSAPTNEAPPNICFSVLLQGTPKPGFPSLFLTPPGSGSAFVYDPLPRFANDMAVYALGSPFVMTQSEATWTVEEASIIFANTIRSLQPQGPYLLGGWSFGGATSYETAYQLHQQGQRVLGIINLDQPFPWPDPKIIEPTVKLLEIIGFYHPICREGSPDMEIPAYRKRHSAASVSAILKYRPRPINTPGNATPIQLFIIWAGHGDHGRLPSALAEASEIVKKFGLETQETIDPGWLHVPRASFGPGGWAEMMGEGNVECHVIDHANHDSLLEPEAVRSVGDLMQIAIDGWLSKEAVLQQNQ